MPACTFIGHADFKESETRLIYDAVTDLITNEGVTTFYVGTHGNFDKAVYRVLCQIENLYKIRIIVVLSSLNKKPNYFDMNKTIFPDILASTPPKFAIIKRNQYVIRQSQYLICCVNNTISNSYRFLEYATKRKLKIINLADLDNKC